MFDSYILLLKFNYLQVMFVAFKKNIIKY